MTSNIQKLEMLYDRNPNKQKNKQANKQKIYKQAKTNKKTKQQQQQQQQQQTKSKQSNRYIKKNMYQRKWCKNENDQKMTQKAVKWGILSWEVS